MSHKYYPIALKVSDGKAVIVGGGNVAERKALGLLDAGALVTVVSPLVTGKLAALAEKSVIKWVKREVRKKDVAGARIVISATDKEEVNSEVSRWTKEAGSIVNVVDRSALSDFISPAILRRGKAIIAVYTDGRDPVLSRDLKRYLKEHWDDFLSFRNRL